MLTPTKKEFLPEMFVLHLFLWVLLHFSLFLSCVHRHTHTQRPRLTEHFPLLLLLPIFESGSVKKPDAHHFARLAGQPGPSISLSLASQCWGDRWHPWVPGTPPLVLTLVQQELHLRRRLPSCLVCFDGRSHYAAQGCLELSIMWFQPPECWSQVCVMTPQLPSRILPQIVQQLCFKVSFSRAYIVCWKSQLKYI